MAEKIIWKGGRSPLSLLSYWISGLLTFWILGLGFLIIIMGIIKMYRTRYSVTSERVKSEYGFLSRVIRDAELDKIQDTLVVQGFLGRLFNYGDLHFSTAGSGGYEIIFTAASNPEEVKAKVRQLKRDPSSVEALIDKKPEEPVKEESKPTEPKKEESKNEEPKKK